MKAKAKKALIELVEQDEMKGGEGLVSVACKNHDLYSHPSLLEDPIIR